VSGKQDDPVLSPSVRFAPASGRPFRLLRHFVHAEPELNEVFAFTEVEG
jgi:hypothetical protein